MTITLTKVSYSEALSEETAAFSATVVIDGAPAFGVSNHGTGGSDEHFPLKGQSRELMARNIQLLADYARTLPPEIDPKLKIGGKPFEYQPDVDSLVGDALDAWLTDREVVKIVRKMRTRVLWIVGKELKQSTPLSPASIPRALELFAQHHPNDLILNNLPTEQAKAKIAELFAAA